MQPVIPRQILRMTTLSLLLLATVSLTACGGGGSSESASTPDANQPGDAQTTPADDDQSVANDLPVVPDGVLPGETGDQGAALQPSEPAMTDESTGLAQPPQVDAGVDPVADPTLPGPVTGLRGVVYTNSEIEIFWQRTGGDTAVAGYRVTRDGEPLDTRDALSLYDDGVTPGNTYSYSVSAISIDGRSGPASQIVLVTPAAGPEITIGNAEARLGYLLSIANREPFEDFRRISDETQRVNYDSVEPGELGFDLRSSGYDVDRDGFFGDYGCLEGGAFEMRQFQSATGGGVGRFSACALPELAGESIIDGGYVWTLDIVKYAFNVGSDVNIGFDAMTLTATDLRRRRLDGDYTGGSGSASSLERWSGLRYTRDAFEGQTRMTVDALTSFEGVVLGDDPEPWRRRWSGAFDVQAPQTGNRPLTLTTQIPFEKEARNACHVRGRLNAIAVDGSQLTMDADNGDPDSIRLDVRIGAETVSRDLPWSDVIRVDGLLDERRDDSGTTVPTVDPAAANPACLERG